MDIGCVLELPTSTMRTIITNATKIKSSAESVILGSAVRIMKGKDKVMEKMERFLSVWIKVKGMCP